MTQSKSVFSALSAVMAAVGHVGKNRMNNQGGGYKYRGIDDVMAAVQPIMAEHGLVCVPRVVEREREHITTNKGSGMVSVRLLVEHTFYGPDGSYVVCTTLGEAFDSGDKASNKAMAVALKYALTETLMIPTYEADRDTEEASPEIAPQSSPSAQSSKTDPWTAAKFEAVVMRIFPGAAKVDVEARTDCALDLMGCARADIPPKGSVWSLFTTGPMHLRKSAIEKAEARLAATDDVPDFSDVGGSERPSGVKQR